MINSIFEFFSFLYHAFISGTINSINYANPYYETCLLQFKVIYFDNSGELVESGVIEAISSQHAEEIFNSSCDNEVFDVIKITK